MRKPKPSGRSWTRPLLGVAPCLLSLTKIARGCRGVSWQSSATARVTGPRVIESGIQMKVSRIIIVVIVIIIIIITIIVIIIIIVIPENSSDKEFRLASCTL